jgi:hypothetical protein
MFFPAVVGKYAPVVSASFVKAVLSHSPAEQLDSGQKIHLYSVRKDVLLCFNSRLGRELPFQRVLQRSKLGSTTECVSGDEEAPA